MTEFVKNNKYTGQSGLVVECIAATEAYAFVRVVIPAEGTDTKGVEYLLDKKWQKNFKRYEEPKRMGKKFYGCLWQYSTGGVFTVFTENLPTIAVGESIPFGDKSSTKLLGVKSVYVREGDNYPGGPERTENPR